MAAKQEALKLYEIKIVLMNLRPEMRVSRILCKRVFVSASDIRSSSWIMKRLRPHFQSRSSIDYFLLMLLSAR